MTRAGAARYAFTVTDLHRLPSAGLPAHPSTTSIATNALQQIASLFDHFVGAQQYRCGDIDVERLSSFLIDDELEPRRLLNRKIGRAGAAQYLVHRNRLMVRHLHLVGSV